MLGEEPVRGAVRREQSCEVGERYFAFAGLHRTGSGSRRSHWQTRDPDPPGPARSRPWRLSRRLRNRLRRPGSFDRTAAEARSGGPQGRHQLDEGAVRGGGLRGVRRGDRQVLADVREGLQERIDGPASRRSLEEDVERFELRLDVGAGASPEKPPCGAAPGAGIVAPSAGSPRIGPSEARRPPRPGRRQPRPARRCSAWVPVARGSIASRCGSI